MSKHSKLSPSGAHRWLACPASIEGEQVDQASPYAAEGTVAHQLADECWALGVRAETFIGKTRSADGYDFEVTEEMAEAVQVYLDLLESLPHNTQFFMEQRIEHPEIADFGGTIDCCAVHLSYVDDTQSLHIVDYKHGAGVAVEVEGDSGHGLWFGRNAQLAAYALLASKKFPTWSGTILVTIVQPRAHHPAGPIRSTEFTLEELEYFESKIREMPDRVGQIQAGAHCKWCPRAAGCPELYQLTVQTAQREFALPDDMTPEKAAQVLELRAPLKVFIDAVEEYAHGQLEKGIEVPGYKLVDRFGNRRWAMDEESISKKLARKYGKKNIYETRLLSPAQMEKVAGKETVSALVERPNLGTTMVPQSDKREAVKRVTASEEFQNCLSESELS